MFGPAVCIFTNCEFISENAKINLMSFATLNDISKKIFGRKYSLQFCLRNKIENTKENCRAFAAYGKKFHAYLEPIMCITNAINKQQ